MVHIQTFGYIPSLLFYLGRHFFSTLAGISCFCVVDLEGVEPSSKRGSHMLSTCLSLPSFFEYRQDQSHQPIP